MRVAEQLVDIMRDLAHSQPDTETDLGPYMIRLHTIAWKNPHGVEIRLAGIEPWSYAYASDMVITTDEDIDAWAQLATERIEEARQALRVLREVYDLAAPELVQP